MPHPDGPMTETNSPVAISKSTPRSARTGAPSDSKFFRSAAGDDDGVAHVAPPVDGRRVLRRSGRPGPASGGPSPTARRARRTRAPGRAPRGSAPRPRRSRPAGPDPAAAARGSPCRRRACTRGAPRSRAARRRPGPVERPIPRPNGGSPRPAQSSSSAALCLQHRERGVEPVLRVVVLRHGRAEARHHRVADELHHGAVAVDDRPVHRGPMLVELARRARSDRTARRSRSSRGRPT